ncbi:MAG: hypothetical protein VW802_00500 [Rhodospirillaceae bacterium]
MNSQKRPAIQRFMQYVRNPGHHIIRAFAALSVGWLAGCAVLEAPTVHDHLHKSRQAHGLNTCINNFTVMDRVTETVADAEAARIPGFPYLRVNRFLASFANSKLHGKAFTRWLTHLRTLDRQARKYEFSNLPAQTQARLKNLPGQLERCAARLMAHDSQNEGIRRRLIKAARAPDSYQRWAQVAGLYPLSVIPVRFGIMHLQKRQRNDFQTVQQPGDLNVYTPITNATYDPKIIQAIFHRAKPDALGIPLFENGDLKHLVSMSAPVIQVIEKSNDDKPGHMMYGTNGTLQIDTSRPVLYHRLAFTRFRGRVLTQLVYTVWFPARTAQGPLDIFAGTLDGIMWRVTLDEDGRPMVYDTIHPCGCYHLFFPVKPWALAAAEQHGFFGEPPIAPIPGPLLAKGQRVHISLKPATHYVSGVSAKQTDHNNARRYRLTPASTLRSLKHPTGSKSLYGPNGLIDISARPERFLLWPMGVPSAGTMRQWGHHATAFIGTRHFDDADLFERILTRKR